jgi:carbonic anhydrase/acetyltransferase-like protein (isoleucine patch superfamily)
MARIIGIWGIKPKIGENCILADDCTVEGNVVIGDACEIGSKSLISGVKGKIIIGNHVKISEHTKISAFLDYVTQIEDNVQISAQTTIQSSILKKNSIVGAKVLLSFAIVEENSKILDSQQITMATWSGNPAKFISTVNPINSEESTPFVSEIVRKTMNWNKNDQTE